MTTAVFPSAAGSLAQELHDTLRQLDPARWRAEKVQALRKRLASIRDRFTPLAKAPKAEPQVQERVRAVADHLQKPMPETGEVQPWVEYRAQVSPAYEALVSVLKEHDVRVPSLRPTNYRRSVAHIIAGIGVLAIIELVPREYLMYPALGAFLTVWALEGTRRINDTWNGRIMKLFDPVAHPYEVHGINSGTWYVTALMALSLLQAPMLGAIAVSILAFADPAAALVGRRFGTIRLVNGRSLQGSFTFFAVGTLVAFAVTMLFHSTIGVGMAVALAVVAALFGALAELFSSRIDDNLSIPLVAAGAAYLLLFLV